ncbi:MAG: endonuclease/exonuclease/phosphatase family protein [Acidobacteria bacterium]|nr:endonuclease/exonuclease/phosphatase family protein [Acidobacteriota bacterium]MCZ6753104.1 endonuclease/exonuclease/phosphatase family protein [Acidobacteriota bacterium]
MPDSDLVIARERKALMRLMDEGPFKIPKRQVDDNLLIATWNIQHFSEKKTQRAIQYMADICERFDIIALQEIKTDLRGLSKLQERLPGNYKILVSDPTGNNERFAFLYDKRTVVSTGLVCEIGFKVLAKTHRGYQLHRMPYCASFRSGRFDFVIANAHIYFGKTAKERLQREEEIQSLVEFIHRRSKTEKTKVFDRDFFVVGDFNIEEAGDQFFNALLSKGFKMPAQLRTLKTNFLQTATYDKIVWVDRPSFSFKDKINVVPFGQVLFRDRNPKGGKKEISDHLPLWAEFRINRLTQELDQIINRP